LALALGEMDSLPADTLKNQTAFSTPG
jgi:hypothetical protein